MGKSLKTRVSFCDRMVAMHSRLAKKWGDAKRQMIADANGETELMSTRIGKGFDIKPGKLGTRTKIKRKAKFYTNTSAAIGAKKKPERIEKRLRANREKTR